MFRDAWSPIVEGLLMISGSKWQHHRMCARDPPPPHLIRPRRISNKAFTINALRNVVVTTNAFMCGQMHRFTGAIDQSQCVGRGSVMG